MLIGAEGRTRTGTWSTRLILSQVRLPIPPLRHVVDEDIASSFLRIP